MSYATLLRWGAALILLQTGHFWAAGLIWGLGYIGQKALYNHRKGRI
jgi:hypothetical protein